MIQNHEGYASPLVLPELLQREIIDLFITNKFVEARRLYKEFVDQLKFSEVDSTINIDEKIAD